MIQLQYSERIFYKIILSLPNIGWILVVWSVKTWLLDPRLALDILDKRKHLVFWGQPETSHGIHGGLYIAGKIIKLHEGFPGFRANHIWWHRRTIPSGKWLRGYWSHWPLWKHVAGFWICGVKPALVDLHVTKNFGDLTSYHISALQLGFLGIASQFST